MIPIDEQETTINILPKQQDEYATVYTCIPSVVKRMRKLFIRDPLPFHKMKDMGDSILCEVPRNWVKISPPRRVNLTDEQREASVERLRIAREKKANEK